MTHSHQSETTRQVLIGTVAETFVVTGRGVGIFFSESPEHIRKVSSLVVRILRPDGTASVFSASREFARKIEARGGEIIALLVAGASLSDIPVGSVVSTPAPI